MCFRPAAVEIERSCPECGGKCPADATACPACGAELPEASPYAVPGAGAPAAPGAPGAPAAPGMPPAPKAPGQ